MISDLVLTILSWDWKRKMEVWPWKHSLWTVLAGFAGWAFRLVIWAGRDWDRVWPLGLEGPSKTKNSVEAREGGRGMTAKEFWGPGSRLEGSWSHQVWRETRNQIKRDCVLSGLGGLLQQFIIIIAHTDWALTLGQAPQSWSHWSCLASQVLLFSALTKGETEAQSS